MDPIHQQVKHPRGSSPHQETVSAPNERADHRWIEQKPRTELIVVPVSAKADPEAGAVT